MSCGYDRILASHWTHWPTCAQLGCEGSACRRLRCNATTVQFICIFDVVLNAAVTMACRIAMCFLRRNSLLGKAELMRCEFHRCRLEAIQTY
jgi:hypothetical protein